METLGACLLGNDLPFTGQAKDIFERRVKGESWAKIAEDYGLGSPNAARKLFKQLTGIGDFKVKGNDLIKLAKGDLGEIPKTPKVVKPKPANKPGGQSEVSKANQPKPKSGDDFKADSSLIDDPPGVSNGTINGVVDDFGDGLTYAQISKKYNLGFKEVDDIVFKASLEVEKGDVWKAWKNKTNSQNAVNSVKTMVHDARKAGWTTDEITKHLGVPKDIQEKIYKGTWKPETLPHQFPKPKAAPSYGTPSQPPSQYSTMGPSTKPKPGEGIELHGESIDFDRDNFPVAQPSDFSRHNSGLTDRAESAVKNYTGSNYITINGALRGNRPNNSATRGLISSMDEAMRPVQKNVTFTRGMDRHGFQMGYIDNDTITGLVGKVVKDPGYFSTSARETAAFGGEILMRIEAPKGTRGVWAKPLSHHSGEDEFLLARGTNIMITGVSKKTNANGVVSFIVKGRVIV